MGIAASIGRSWLIGVEIRGMELNSYWLKKVLFSLFFFFCEEGKCQSSQKDTIACKVQLLNPLQLYELYRILLVFVCLRI